MDCKREIFSGVIAGVGKNKRVNDDGVSGERGESLDCFTWNISGSEGWWCRRLKWSVLTLKKVKTKVGDCDFLRDLGFCECFTWNKKKDKETARYGVKNRGSEMHHLNKTRRELKGCFTWNIQEVKKRWDEVEDRKESLA